jgi:hypothetical protein
MNKLLYSYKLTISVGGLAKFITDELAVPSVC